MTAQTCEAFTLYRPDEPVISRMRITSRAGSVRSGRRTWCHALALPQGEVVHTYYHDDTTVDVSHYGGFVVVLRMGAALAPLGDDAATPFGEILVSGDGVLPACKYVGGTHEFIVFSDSVPTRPVLQRATVQLVSPIWRLILSLREGKVQAVCNLALEELITRAQTCVQAVTSEPLLRAMAILERSARAEHSCSQIARSLGVSLSHLCRLFRTNLDMSIREFTQRIRLNRAAGLLWGTRIPIGNIAAMCGFYDQAHMTRVMARRFALTPSEFRVLAPCRGNERLGDIKMWVLSSEAVTSFA